MRRRSFTGLLATSAALGLAWRPVRAAPSWSQAVERGEAMLRIGNAPDALAAFESAAGQVHAAEVELGIVRAHMQAGNYRRALSFAAHVSGAHLDEPGANAMYAWLLHAGGQKDIASSSLQAGLATHPESAALQQAAAALQQPWPRPGPALMGAPLRVAPYAWPEARATGSATVSSAVLTGDGGHAVAPAAALRGQAAVWLRNGLGQTVGATLQDRDARGELALLRLDTALPVSASFATTHRSPYAGSPGSLVGFAVDASGAPAWPWLHAGFFGSAAGRIDARLAGLGAPRGSQGCSVFDAAGRFAGIAIATDRGAPRLLEASAIGEWRGAPVAPVVEVTPQRAPFDSVYETALLTTLQVVVRREPGEVVIE